MNMKKMLILPMIALLAAGVSSCDLFGEADDISFDAELPLEFVVDEKMVSSSPVNYTKTKTIDATSNPDVAKYKDKIKDFKVNKVTYTISGYVAPNVVTFSNGKLSVASSGKTIASATSVDLTNSAETELNADVDGFNALAERLKIDKSETVTLSGTFSSTPVAFVVTAKFYVTITADALK